ncbi:DNA cytosine methyltransferase, partial [Collinsella vaginalis]|uniref:DNA cytosine methyltransferase n=1 Tax=Collinsella vaginalis TaxID=1870987 RepID=UPI0015C51509
LNVTDVDAVLVASDTQAHASVSEGLSPALTRHAAKDAPVVAFAANQRGEVRLQGGDGLITGAIPASQPGKQVNGVADGAVLRRLTPTECERLQGFPDGWTDVTFRGRPAADTPRYRALGNSMAVPVMRWIGERLAAADLLAGGEGAW